MRCKSAVYWGVFTLLAGTVSIAAAQSDCLKGNVNMAFGVNGTITVCPQAAAKAPELQKQIDQIERTLRGNQALLLEVTQSVRSVNALSRDVNADRQVELLRSFSRELEKLDAADQQKTQASIANLANKLDSLQDTITQMREDDKTAQQTRVALDGQLGDAIAALDLAKAQQQLDSIQAQLTAINQNTASISQDTSAIRRTLSEQEARQQAADQEAKKKQAELDANPRAFANAMISPNTSGGYMMFFGSRAPDYPLFNDSTLSIAFHDGSGQAWRVDAVDKQVYQNGEMWNVTFADVGDQATVCFATKDAATGRQKVWTQHYKLIPNPGANQYMTQKKFAPVGLPELALSNGPCDGAAEVRPEGTPVSLTSRLQQQQKDQMDRIQQQYKALGMTPPDPNNPLASLAQMREKSLSDPRMFAHIDLRASRRLSQNSGQWAITVSTAPIRLSQTFYDARVEANLVDPSGRALPLQFSGRDQHGNVEIRTALTSRMGSKIVVCLTATDPVANKPRRMTRSFNITTQGDASSNTGEQAAFIPTSDGTLTDAGDGPCQ